MKVNIYQTVDVTEEQRVKLANILDEKVTKRIATRDELKDYIWRRGAEDWETALVQVWDDMFGETPTEPGPHAAPAPEVDDALESLL